MVTVASTPAPFDDADDVADATDSRWKAAVAAEYNPTQL